MNNFLKKINKFQLFIGGCFLIMMIFITCANILLRQFGIPVRGTFEIMGFLGVMIFAFSLGYSHKKKEHLYVSIIFDRYPEKLKKASHFMNNLICIFFFSLVSWQLVKKALILKNVHEVSETLRIIYYPFILVLSFGMAVLVLHFIYELFIKSGDNS